ADVRAAVYEVHPATRVRQNARAGCARETRADDEDIERLQAFTAPRRGARHGQAEHPRMLRSLSISALSASLPWRSTFLRTGPRTQRRPGRARRRISRRGRLPRAS